MSTCKNCGTAVTERYCPKCGQQDFELQRPFLALFGELLREAFDVDGRAARTVWTMLAHPGVVTARFLAGQRRQFTPPIRLYLVVSVSFFFVMAWVVRQGILFDVNARSAGAVRVLSEDLPRLMFLLLPVFALLLKAAFWRRLYIDHLIHALHLHAAAYVVIALMLPLELLGEPYWIALLLHGMLYAYFGMYIALSLRRVYDDGWIATALKALAVSVSYAVILGSSLELASLLMTPVAS